VSLEAGAFVTAASSSMETRSNSVISVVVDENAVADTAAHQAQEHAD